MLSSPGDLNQPLSPDEQGDDYGATAPVVPEQGISTVNPLLGAKASQDAGKAAVNPDALDVAAAVQDWGLGRPRASSGYSTGSLDDLRSSLSTQWKDPGYDLGFYGLGLVGSAIAAWRTWDKAVFDEQTQTLAATSFAVATACTLAWRYGRGKEIKNLCHATQWKGLVLAVSLLGLAAAAAVTYDAIQKSEHLTTTISHFAEAIQPAATGLVAMAGVSLVSLAWSLAAGKGFCGAEVRSVRPAHLPGDRSGASTPVGDRPGDVALGGPGL